MTLRQRLADRANLVARLYELAQFVASTPAFDEILDGTVWELTFPVQSKVEADEVIRVYGARPLWRNGYYMAEWSPGMVECPAGIKPKLLSELPPRASEDTGDDVTFELHFAPLITTEKSA